MSSALPEDDLHLAWVEDRLLVRGEASLPSVGELREILPEAGAGDGLNPEELELPEVGGRRVRVYDVPEGWDPPEGWTARTLRSLHAEFPAELFQLVGLARQKLEWLRTHRFCSRCGHPTEAHDRHQAMACPDCGQLHFPRIAPAVIVLVTRGEEMLLGRSPHFPDGMFSTLAGFVEPGESLEETLHREIREEVGVEVDDLRYQGSQPWPFPHSLMVGFRARWAGGEVRVDGTEVVEAGWFARDRLPPRLPFPLSIARQMIDGFLGPDAAPDGPR